MRRFGLLFCLVVYPLGIGLIVSALFVTNFIGINTSQLMWFIFLSMIIIKGLNYALNNPTKEVMYIPTSTNIKFKAKSWIDGFGNRSTKAVGAVVTDNLGYSLTKLFNYRTVISLGVVGVWVVVASLLGKKFNKLQKENKIVE